jgi:hypothetical protein
MRESSLEASGMERTVFQGCARRGPKEGKAYELLNCGFRAVDLYDFIF